MNRKSFLKRFISGITAFLSLPLFSRGKKPKEFKGFIKGTRYYDTSRAPSTIVSCDDPWESVVPNRDGTNGIACNPPVFRTIGRVSVPRYPAPGQSELRRDIANSVKPVFDKMNSLNS